MTRVATEKYDKEWCLWQRLWLRSMTKSGGYDKGCDWEVWQRVVGWLWQGLWLIVWQRVVAMTRIVTEKYDKRVVAMTRIVTEKYEKVVAMTRIVTEKYEKEWWLCQGLWLRNITKGGGYEKGCDLVVWQRVVALRRAVTEKYDKEWWLWQGLWLRSMTKCGGYTHTQFLLYH